MRALTGLEDEEFMVEEVREVTGNDGDGDVNSEVEEVEEVAGCEEWFSDEYERVG
jgi:hypothetical protein